MKILIAHEYTHTLYCWMQLQYTAILLKYQHNHEKLTRKPSKLLRLSSRKSKQWKKDQTATAHVHFNATRCNALPKGKIEIFTHIYKSGLLPCSLASGSLAATAIMLATKYKFLQFTVEWTEWQGLILVRGLSRKWVSDLRPARATMALFIILNTWTQVRTGILILLWCIFDHSRQWAIKIHRTNCFKDKNHLP